MPENPGLVDEFKQIGNVFKFELFLEFFHGELIKGFRSFLADYSPEKLKEMVTKGEFPYIPADSLTQIQGYEKYVARISPERFTDFLAEARPDLVKALEEMGMEGALYVVKLREHYLALIQHPEKAQELPEIPPKDLVTAVCDACRKSWVVPREEFQNIKECPFCHLGQEASSEQ